MPRYWFDSKVRPTKLYGYRIDHMGATSHIRSVFNSRRCSNVLSTCGSSMAVLAEGRVYLAYDTLARIDLAIAADGGARYRGLLRMLMPLAEDAYSEKEESFRKHLGCSVIGKDCDRALFYGYRWAAREVFPAKMYRLFNRGHLEEPRMVAALQLTGATIYQYTEDGKQYKLSEHNGCYGSSLDGVATGIIEIPGEPVLTEFKTHNDKSFVKLSGENWDKHLADPNSEPFRGEGMRASKPAHYAQVQAYMRGYGLRYCLYMATNKNTDAIYAEIVAADFNVGQYYSDRAFRIIHAVEAPPRINESPGYFKCKYCYAKKLCHGKKDLPFRNCRTCNFGGPGVNGNWNCYASGAPQERDYKAQLEGCGLYAISGLFK